ncbi:sensor histidine kinase [Vagococcus hydrophili]|uniref:histidine kinase n=1 Tax=Vagococcus hydrophili TaxID=2714947 RepID=A0A6G8AU81_9ENTE|nr:sensor histidine kinase [Vagococcus hydrophili]QIL48540.1 sensor histidine kinase [Vagococcus hydrophili]
MIELFIMMMERVGLIILLAYLLVNLDDFKTLLFKREMYQSKIKLIVFFCVFAIISNLTGIEISGDKIMQSNVLTHISNEAAIANTRTLAISVSGLVGGPVVGVMVGFVAGIHRAFQGTGITGLFYIPSSILIGILSGLFGQLLTKKNLFPNPFHSGLVSALMEMIQMLFVLFFTGSLAEGFALVKLISIPMVLLNSVGTFIFMSILNSTLNQVEEAKAIQTHDVLELAAKTLPYFRKGLEPGTSQDVAKIIQHYTKVSAISITDNSKILAHVGAGSDHHIPEKDVITELSKEVLQTGKIAIAYNKTSVGCTEKTCPLSAAIVIPLMNKENIAGTLKLYFTDSRDLTELMKSLAEGLGTIFSSQIELGEAEIQTQLLKEAEIKSLQSQVNPHFFFNSINTISALMRKDSEKARELLLQLSQYFRSNLKGAAETLVPLEQELAQVDAYLILEQTRFPDKYEVTFDIQPETLNVSIPPFALQILIENAIKHAFDKRKQNNQIQVSIYTDAEKLKIDVRDNGTGITDERILQIGQGVLHSEVGSGTALYNLVRRIDSLFGEKGKFDVYSRPEGGSQFLISIPIIREEF